MKSIVFTVKSLSKLFTPLYRIETNISISKKMSRKYWINLLKNQTKQFCSETSLHGFRQMASSNRSKVERVFWSLIVGISLCCAISLMQKAWEYNSIRPTITVIESTHRGIWNYPFPAVTICNINRISIKRTNEFVNKLKIPADVKRKDLMEQMKLLMELIHPGSFGDEQMMNLYRLQSIFNANNLSIPSVMDQITQSCSDLLLSCKWNGEWENCSEIFSPSLAREGYCCSFNYIPFQDPRILPKRTTSCGYQNGLTVQLNADPDDYMSTIIGSYGVKVILHYPYNYPDNNAENRFIGMGYEVFFSVSPEEIFSTSRVKNLPMDKRQCTFEDEQDHWKENSQLAMPGIKYSYTNCLSRCRGNQIYSKCSCVPFYYPQNGTRTCALTDVTCLKEFEEEYEKSTSGSIFVDEHYTTGTNNYRATCGCIPDCTTFFYPVEDSHGMLSTSKKDLDLFFNNINVTNQNIIHIFFGDLVAIQYRRRVYFDWRDIFASFGGLLALFSGFSFMSVIELIFFFVIRVYNDRKKQRK